MPKTLGIFKGKKEEYNRLILKGLSTGPMKTIQIAEYIYLNQENAPVALNHNEVKSINSIICRRNSRIDELSSKGYIERKDDLWKLDSKGTCVSLTLFDDFDEVKKLVDFDELQLQFKEVVRKVKKHPLIDLMTAPLRDNTIKNQYNMMENNPKFLEQFVFKLRASTNEMIREGVNLDMMSNQRFLIILASEISSWMEGESVNS
ncbi:hypothetical protein MUP37_03020 [Candidatus Bathyarchaeota archaeon]|nr:hypothetical protein [Candidatus Bathyarchaeota archaeon]